ncbi:MAG: hypothetical protein ACI9W6_001484 [Motiliproteus sp.]|jgi:hypothetical protein
MKNYKNKRIHQAVLSAMSTLALSAGMVGQAHADPAYTCENLGAGAQIGPLSSSQALNTLLNGGDILTFTVATATAGGYVGVTDATANSSVFGQYASPDSSNTFSYTVPGTGARSFNVHGSSCACFATSVTYTLACSQPGARESDASAASSLMSSLTSAQNGMTINNVAQHLQGSAGNGVTGGAGGEGNDQAKLQSFTALEALLSEPVLGASTTRFGGVSNDGGWQPSAPSSLSVRDAIGLFNFDTSKSSPRALNAAQDAATTRVPGGVKDLASASKGVSVWGYGSFQNLNNSLAGGNYNGDSLGYNLGADIRLSDNMLVGAAIGYNDSRITTAFNTGKHNETATSISPYLSYKINANTSYSGVIGAGWGTINNSRTNNTVTGKTDTGSRFMYNSLSYTRPAAPDDAFTVSGTLSHSYAHKAIEAYTESDATQVAKYTTRTSQWSLKAEVARNLQIERTNMKVFANAALLRDTLDTVNNDPNALDISTGLRFLPGASGWFGSLSGSQQFLRKNYTQWSVQGLLGYNLPKAGASSQQLRMQSQQADGNTGLNLSYALANKSGDAQAMFTLGSTRTLYTQLVSNYAQLNASLKF